MLAILLVALGCSDPSEDLSPACRQAAGEWTTFGCAVLAGQVIDTAGHPVSDVRVNFRALRPYGSTQFPFDVDEDGAFRQTSDLLSEPVSFPDTVTVMVTASAIGLQYPQPTPTTFIQDSIAAVLTYSPNGGLPIITFVQIQLAIP
ncbi:MAG TPA: hypothetical protein VFS51_04150 [Gemmatimonadales bacterium]|nr:hypothetical protein [Gemmatimonadales bacterium]